MNFDYIVVGAGSAGCVVANRLTEDPACRVLLLEAGGKPTTASAVPGFFTSLFHSKMDWGFQTEPQPNLNFRRLYVPRGKVLGGSSTTNAMAYVRGNPKDFDSWENEGNTGWGFSNVLEYFKKSEHHETYDNIYHHKHGLLNVTFATYPSPLSQVFIEACRSSGIPFNEDYNGAEQLGASMLQFTIKNNRRHSAYSAFIAPILHRKNLTIRTEAQVKRVLIKDSRAEGVELIKGSEEIRCSKEVILCAGAIQSPHILLLSGVGPKEELARHGIALKVELEGVGQNLQDHLFSPVTAYCNVRTMNHYLKPISGLVELARYLILNRGSLTNSFIEANAFIKTREGIDVPDAQFHFAPSHLGEDPSAEMYRPKTVTRANGFGIAAILIHPESRGSISLQSSNAAEAPRIHPNFLSVQSDKDTLRRALRKALEVANCNAFAKYAPQGTYAPLANANDEEIDTYIQNKVETLYHPVGTCKMGNNRLAVVDKRLKVRGADRLRVIDASIMPTIVSGNTNAACIMIGEKGADLIKEGES